VANKTDLKAYLKYDGSGKMIPGSLILSRSKPKVGDWSEIDAYKCCNGPAPTICSNFWINQTVNSESADTLYALGSAIDSNCNSFMLMVDYWLSPNNPNQNSYVNSLLQKFNDAGELVWSRTFDFAENGTSLYIETETIAIDKEDNPICFFTVYGGELDILTTTAITKFDNDGNELWSIVLDRSVYSANIEYVESVAFDAANNMYVSFLIQPLGGIGNNIVIVRKISPAGVVLASKTVTFIDNVFSPLINVNSAGEVYLVCTTPDTDKSYIVKLDSSLIEIWNKSFSAGNLSGAYGIAFDKDENIVLQIGNGANQSYYSNPLYGAYIKMSPEGNVIWTTKISNINTIYGNEYVLGTFQLNSDGDGNIYISSYLPNTPIPGYTLTYSSSPLIIAKLLSNGSFEWAYIIESPNDIAGYFWGSPIVGNLVNNSLVLAFYDNTDPYNAQLFKLPLTPVADGVYGSYKFTDITNLWTTSSPTPTFIDSVANYYDVPTTVIPITYLTFEGTYTTINTPL
jgi:hypothetical protein